MREMDSRYSVVGTWGVLNAANDRVVEHDHQPLMQGTPCLPMSS